MFLAFPLRSFLSVSLAFCSLGKFFFFFFFFFFLLTYYHRTMNLRRPFDDLEYFFVENEILIWSARSVFLSQWKIFFFLWLNEKWEVEAKRKRTIVFQVIRIELASLFFIKLKIIFCNFFSSSFSIYVKAFLLFLIYWQEGWIYVNPWLARCTHTHTHRVSQAGTQSDMDTMMAKWKRREVWSDSISSFTLMDASADFGKWW